MSKAFDDIVAGYYQPFGSFTPLQEKAKQFTRRNLSELLAMRQRDKYIKEVKVCVAGLGKADEEEPLEEEGFSQFQFYQAYTEGLVYFEDKFDFLIKCVSLGICRVQPGFEERYTHALLTVLTFRELQPPQQPDQVLDLRQLSTPRTIGEDPGSPEKQEEQFETYRNLQHPFADDIRGQLAVLEEEQKQCERDAENRVAEEERQAVEWGDVPAAEQQKQPEEEKEQEETPAAESDDRNDGRVETSHSALNSKHAHKHDATHIHFHEAAEEAAIDHDHGSKQLPKDAPLHEVVHDVNDESEALRKKIRDLENKLAEAENENRSLREAASPVKEVTSEGEEEDAAPSSPPKEEKDEANESTSSNGLVRRRSSLKQADTPKSGTHVQFDSATGEGSEETPSKELPKDVPLMKDEDLTDDGASPQTKQDLPTLVRRASEHQQESALKEHHEHQHDPNAHVEFDAPPDHPHRQLPKDVPIHHEDKDEEEQEENTMSPSESRDVVSPCTPKEPPCSPASVSDEADSDVKAFQLAIEAKQRMREKGQEEKAKSDTAAAEDEVPSNDAEEEEPPVTVASPAEPSE